MKGTVRLENIVENIHIHTDQTHTHTQLTTKTVTMLFVLQAWSHQLGRSRSDQGPASASGKVQRD